MSYKFFCNTIYCCPIEIYRNRLTPSVLLKLLVLACYECNRLLTLFVFQQFLNKIIKILLHILHEGRIYYNCL